MPISTRPRGLWFFTRSARTSPLQQSPVDGRHHHEVDLQRVPVPRPQNAKDLPGLVLGPLGTAVPAAQAHGQDGEERHAPGLALPDGGEDVGELKEVHD